MNGWFVSESSLHNSKGIVMALKENSRVRFAVVGCGMLARGQHIPNLAKSSKAMLHTVCDADPSALELCKPFNPVKYSSDFREAVRDPDVDAICLAATEKLRLPVIELAASLGKPVYVEKPLARELDEIYAIQKIVNQSGIPFCVGHNRRSSPAMVHANRVFREHMDAPKPNPWRWSREGDERANLPDDGVPAIAIRINDDWYSWKNWVFDKTQAPHGPMLFEMTHFTDMANWFMASEPVEVVAIETGMLTHSVIIRYASGSLATIASSANGTFGYPKERYECMGNGGVVTIEHLLEVRTAGLAGQPPRTTFAMLNDRHPNVGTEGGLDGWLAKKRAAADEALAKNELMLQFAAEPDRGHARQLDRFVDQIRGTGPEVCGVDKAVLATRIAFAAIKSAHERRLVAMSEI
jgi:predicted dehydrogenase